MSYALLFQCSLSAFREDFLRDGIDGSKLLSLNSREVNQIYKRISSKKRNILIDHLNRIESSRQPPTWNSAPYLPPRSGVGNSRMPAPTPLQNPDNLDESDDGGWSDEFEDVDDYLEPASGPLHPGSSMNGNHQMFEGPEEAYEIPENELDEIRQQPHTGFERKPTIVDRLRDELSIFKGDNRQEPAAGGTPPPRPPRSNRLPGGGSPLAERHPPPPAHHHTPPPPPPPQNIQPPENEYEVMNDVITETQKNQRQYSPPPAGADFDLPPRPARRGVPEIPSESPPPSQSAQRPRYAYQKVNKPGRLVQEDELSGYDWYHGKIGRDHAQTIFHREQQSGMFLVRKSERDPKQPYTLVLWHCDRIWNIPIRKKDNGKYAAGIRKEGETEFFSVAEIVDHFKEVSLKLKSNANIQGSHTLTVPAPKN
ncbi:hypothetical protein ACOMHN_033519 [Nucella lapillus]